MRTLILGLALAAVAAAPAAARPYTVDKTASRLGFTVGVSGRPVDGTFRRWDAAIDFDPNDLPASRASVTVDVSSAATGDRSRDGTLAGPDWFGAGQHPRATFVTRAITRTGPNRYQAAGDLTIKGVRRPVVLPFTLQLNGGAARMQGRLTLDRNSFGVGRGQAASAVAPQVTVVVDLTARAR